MISFNNNNITEVYVGNQRMASGFTDGSWIFPTSTPPTPPAEYKAKVYSHDPVFVTDDKYTIEIPLNGSSILTYEEINSIAKAGYFVEITTAVTELGIGVFNQIDSVSGYSLPNTLKVIDDSAFRLCSGLTNITLPNSLETIGDWAFAYTSSLTSITIPSSVKLIDMEAFLSSHISSITFEEGIETIGHGAFSSTFLTSVTIPNSVTTLEPSCFRNNKRLESLTIGSGLTLISDSAFLFCTSLVDITSLAMQAPLINPTNPNSFSNIGSNGVLHVPSGSSGYDAWLRRLDNWTIDYF